jgi:cation:H+ antiporter
MPRVTYLLLVASFVLIVVGAFLFTNAVEWAGVRLGLAQGAVGSLLAAVATALPESVIPVIALVKGSAPEQQAIAIGAIIGAPFLLGTLAMGLVGLSAFAFRKRREQGEEIRSEIETGQRDFAFFVAFFGAAILLGAIGAPGVVRIPAAILFVVAYFAYTVWTIRRGQGGAEGEPDSPLYFDWTRDDPPNNFQLILQLVVSIAAIVGGANLFVTEVEHVAVAIGVPLLVLALVLAPLATELPEKANSFIWVRDGKDSLALGNITGAMVFQSSLPVAFGVAFTPWVLEPSAIVAGVVGLVGGILAWWRLRRRAFNGRWQIVWFALYLGYVGYAVVASGALGGAPPGPPPPAPPPPPPA